VEPLDDDPTRNFSMLSISVDMVDLLASEGIVVVTEDVDEVTEAELGSIS